MENNNITEKTELEQEKMAEKYQKSQQETPLEEKTNETRDISAQPVAAEFERDLPEHRLPFFCFTPQQLEFDRIKRVSTAVGIALTAVVILMRNWSTVFTFFALLLGMSRESLRRLYNDPYFLESTQIVLSTVTFTLPFIIAARACGRRISDIVPLGRAKKGTALPYFFFGLSLCAISNFLSSQADVFFAEFLDFFGIHYGYSGYSDRESPIFLISLISTAIIPALVEEFACRGVVFGLLKEHGEGAAVIVSSVLFGLVHANFSQIPFAFLAGLGFALARIKTGTLWIPCAIHFCNNLISVLLDGPLNFLSSMEKGIFYVIFILVSLFLGIVGIMMRSVKDGESAELGRNSLGTDTSAVVKASFKSPGIIVFAVIAVLSSFAFFRI